MKKKMLFVSSLLTFLFITISTNTIDLAAVSALGAPAPSVAWRKTYGRENYPDDALSVAQTSDGGFVLYGQTSYSLDGSGHDLWLVKTDSNGNMQWNTTLGSGGGGFISSDDYPYRNIVQTVDGGYLVASASGGPDVSCLLWLTKIDSFGNVKWKNSTYESTVGSTGTLIQTSDGGYAIFGTRPGHSFRMIKIDSAGNIEWNKKYTLSNEYLVSMVLATDGGYALAGYKHDPSEEVESYDNFWLVKTDVGGNIKWNKTYGGLQPDHLYDVICTKDNGFALVGFTLSFGAGSFDFWLVKTDSDGNMEWNRAYGTSEYEVASSIIQTIDGGYVIVGWESLDIVKTDPNGSLQWSDNYGDVSLYDLVQTGDEGYALLGGVRESGTPSSRDFHLIRLSPVESSDLTDPVADAGLDQTVDEDTEVTFDGSPSSDNVGISSYSWRFTDGTIVTLSGEKPNYVFHTPRIYTITLTVTDAAGNSANDNVVITVVDITKPSANAGQNLTTTVGKALSLDASASNDNVGIASYEWNLGDGTTGTGRSITHTYASIGNYTVTLTVEDAAGNFDNDTITVTVRSDIRQPENLPMWVIGVIIIGAGATITAVILWKRRKKAGKI